MGTEWYRDAIQRPRRNSLGEYARNIGHNYIDTQEKGADRPGTGTWDPGLIPTAWHTPVNKLAKKELKKQLARDDRGIQSSEFLNWLSPTYGKMATDAAAIRLNEINPLSKSQRLSVGDYGVGGWNLIPDYNESQTRGLDQHIRKNPENDGSRYYTGATPTYKDVKPTDIWHIDPTWQRRD
jgi:hypothetical protein